MNPKAFVLTAGHLNTDNAKTAHGLIRGTDRYNIVAVIDEEAEGQDAGELLDGTYRDIPVLASLERAVSFFPDVEYLIIGVATVGGILPDEMLPTIELALKSRISIVNGLHDYLSEKDHLLALAEKNGVSLIDIRKPKKPQDLRFWTGEVFQVDVPIIAVIGTDCALGKRTTARLIREEGERQGLRAEMIYTGQTGWLQGGKYGFILDSTLNDFVSGELEKAILTCWKETNPDFILLEGQSALRNPSGPCGLELLISGCAKHVVLVHAPKRTFYEDDPAWGKIPSVESEIGIIKSFGAEVIALALNTHGCTKEEARKFQQAYKASLHIPVLLPIIDGVQEILPLLKTFTQQNN